MINTETYAQIRRSKKNGFSMRKIAEMLGMAKAAPQSLQMLSVELHKLHAILMGLQTVLVGTIAGFPGETSKE